ncbi:hypothetical protein J6TS2_18820 [Heyndrickxia sporothermodurans]|nr:hypothetical protein J6TS2_18820 [Heyndrickxia sporothermodurans]
MLRNNNVLSRNFNQKGFTILESIFSILILLLIITFFPLFIKAYEQTQHSLSTEEDFEWNLFLIQLRKEIRTSDAWKINGNRLFLYFDNIEVLYEQYGNSIRRRVDSKGHEVVLQKVKSILLSNENNGFSLNILFQKGVKKNGSFILIPPRVISDE